MSRDERALEAGLSDPAVPRVLGTGELEVLGPPPERLEPHVPRPRPRRGRGDCSPSTSPAAGRRRCGTSRRARSAPARWRPTSSRGRSAGRTFPPPSCGTGRTAWDRSSGSCRHDPEEHYFTLAERFPDEFRRVAAFDMVINNADRKSGHCLLGEDGRDLPRGSRGVLQRRAEAPDRDLGLHRRPAGGAGAEPTCGGSPARSAAGRCATSSPTSCPSPSWRPSRRARRGSPRWSGSPSRERTGARSPGRRSDACGSPGDLANHDRDAARALHGLRRETRASCGRGSMTTAEDDGAELDAVGGSAADRVDPPRGRRVLPWHAPGVRDAGRPVGVWATDSRAGPSRPCARSPTGSSGPTGTWRPPRAQPAAAARRAARSRAARSSCSSPAIASSAPGPSLGSYGRHDDRRRFLLRLEGALPGASPRA